MRVMREAFRSEHVEVHRHALCVGDAIATETITRVRLFAIVRESAFMAV
jgi:hypothetical protein